MNVCASDGKFVYDIPTRVYFGPDQLGSIDPNPRASFVNAGAEIYKKEKIEAILRACL